MNICAAVVINVSKPWFFGQMSQHLHAHTVGLRVLNVCSPLLPAPPLLEGRAVRLQQRDAVAAAFLELPNKVGGAALRLHTQISPAF